MAPHSDHYGSYRLVSLRSFDGREGLAFAGVFTKAGERIMTVRNAGDGSNHRYDPIGSFRTLAEVEAGFAAHAAVLERFEEFAVEWNRGSEYAETEEADALVWRLVDVNTLSSRRAVLFLTDGQDFWTDGEANQCAAGVTYD